MSRAIRIVVTVFLACICQTDLVKYIRIAGIAPDMLTVFLVLGLLFVKMLYELLF